MRGRPKGSVNGYVGAAIPLTEYERCRETRTAWQSRTLLERMLAVGAKSGGCLDLSAAQCRRSTQKIA